MAADEASDTGERDFFARAFESLTGHGAFPWQQDLFDRFCRGTVPPRCVLPSGLGKTNAIAVWLIALAQGAGVPRRLVYVVNRRTVVDQTTAEVERLRQHLDRAGPAVTLEAGPVRPIPAADQSTCCSIPQRQALRPCRRAAAVRMPSLVGLSLACIGNATGVYLPLRPYGTNSRTKKGVQHGRRSEEVNIG